MPSIVVAEPELALATRGTEIQGWLRMRGCGESGAKCGARLPRIGVVLRELLLMLCNDVRILVKDDESRRTVRIEDGSK